MAWRCRQTPSTRPRESLGRARPPTRVSDPDNLPPPRVHDRSQVKSIIRRARVARALDEVQPGQAPRRRLLLNSSRLFLRGHAQVRRARYYQKGRRLLL